MQRVLLVDSDKGVRDVLATTFAGRYELLYATTGGRGLELAKKARPFLAILECLLRDISGLELLKRFKAALPTLPVVMIAPYDSDWIRATVFHAGAREYLTKPIDTLALQAIIQECVLRDFPNQARPGRSDAADRALIAQAVSFINEHFTEPLSLTLVASHLAVSKFALCRKFVAVENVSFRDYLLQIRLTKARELLSARRHSITEIALMVGFGDLPRFDKVFKRATGSAPSAYRSAALSSLLRTRLAGRAG